MISMFETAVHGERIKLYIVTEDERSYDVLICGDGKELHRTGFLSWFEAYDYGMRLASRC